MASSFPSRRCLCIDPDSGSSCIARHPEADQKDTDSVLCSLFTKKEASFVIKWNPGPPQQRPCLANVAPNTLQTLQRTARPAALPPNGTTLQASWRLSCHLDCSALVVTQHLPLLRLPDVLLATRVSSWLPVHSGLLGALLAPSWQFSALLAAWCPPSHAALS